MTSPKTTIENSIKAVLESPDAFSQSVVVSRIPKEIKTLEDINVAHIDVFCQQTACKLLDRSTINREMQLEIGILQKVGFSGGELNQTKIDALTELSEEVYAASWLQLAGIVRGGPFDGGINYEPAPELWVKGVYAILITMKFYAQTALGR